MIFNLKPDKSDNVPVAIVFEAGATHNGLASAKKLVDVAAASGADAIKFQVVDAIKLVPSKEIMFTYEILKDKATGVRETVKESLREILLRRKLDRDEWRELVRYCKQKEIIFFATATDIDDMRFLADIGCACIKIASGDITYHHLLREAAKFPWTVQIDTGSATLGEVEQAVDALESAGCHDIIINHCPSGYPAMPDNINLRVITTLKQMFPYPIAFSDHNPGMKMDVAAVALGANILEKTITLDRTIRSPEHIMSLEPDEAKDFVDAIHEVERALGKPRRPADPAGAVNVARRSVVASRDIEEGEIITQDKLDYVRPGDGLAPNLDFLLIGKILAKPHKKGDKLFPSDVKI